MPSTRESGNNPIRIEDREQLIFMLSEAATLEHMILVGYLFTMLSMKRGPEEGLTESQAETVHEWTEAIEHVAEQEMLHLALVNNMLTSVGAAPPAGVAPRPLY